MSRNQKSKKPYDASASFVKKMTRRVSEYIPNKLTSWFSTTNQEESAGAEVVPIQTSQPQRQSSTPSPTAPSPPPKRMKTELNAIPSAAAPTVSFPSTIPFPVDEGSSSSESTSGCSSLVPQDNQHNEVPVDNQMNSSPKSSQLYTLLFDPNQVNHSAVEINKITPQPPAKSKKLGFDASLARSPLMPSSNRHDITRSPFYQGKTCYGGASAYRRSFGTSPLLSGGNLDLNSSSNSIDSSSLRSPYLRLGDNATPSKSKFSPSPHMNSITQRLLKAVEDATPSSSRDQRSLKRRFTNSDTPKHTEVQGPPTRSLNAPTVFEMMSQKAVNARNLTLPKSKPAWKDNPVMYTLRQEESSASKHSSKVRRNQEMNEMPEHVELPNVTLQMNSLPTFDFAPPISAARDPELAAFSFSAPLAVGGPGLSIPPALKFPAASISQTKVAPQMNFAIKNVTAAVPAIQSSGFGDKFKAAAGSFTCPICMVVNKPEATECVSCGCKKEKPAAPKPPTPAIPTMNFKPAPSIPGLGFMFKKPEGNWECSVCMISNKKEDDKCVACTQPNPSSKPKVNSDSGPAKIASSPFISSGFGSAFKKPAGSWDCSECLVSNKADASKCVACESLKPGSAPAKPAAPLASSGWGSAFQKPAGSWECSACMVTNKPELAKCISCETPKAGPAAAAQVVPIANNFGDKFKKSADKWSCPVCMVNNGQELDKCAACSAENPSKQKSSKPKEEESKLKFNFDMKATEPSGFKFDAPPKKESDKPSIMFGMPKDLGEKAAPAANKGFVFGGEKTEKTGEFKNISFGVAPVPKTVTAPAVEPVATPPMMQFINPTQTASSPTPKLKRKAADEDSPFSMGSPSKVNPPAPKVGGDALKFPAFSFSSVNSAKLPPLMEAPPADKGPSFNFMNEDEADKKKDSALSSLFSAPPSGATSLFTFANKDKAPEADANKSLFQFGTVAKKDNNAGSGFSTPSFGLDAKSPAAPFTAKPTFDLKPDGGGSSVFGAKSSDLSFGAKPKSDMFAAKPASGFGGQVASKETVMFKPPEKTGLAFGTSSFGAPAPTSFGSEASPFTSGTTTSLFNVPPAPGLSTFGNPSVSQAAPAASAFGTQPQFSASQPPAAIGGFAFMNNSGAPPPGGSVFSFNSDKPPAIGFAAKPAEPTSIFGAASAPAPGAANPAFGGAKPFGAPVGGFNFASAAASFSQPQPAQQQNAGPVGGFSFNPVQAPVPQFNPDLRPTFNFTGNTGSATFNATNTMSSPNPNAAMQARKIRKATRRMQPR